MVTMKGLQGIPRDIIIFNMLWSIVTVYLVIQLPHIQYYFVSTQTQLFHEYQSTTCMMKVNGISSHKTVSLKMEHNDLELVMHSDIMENSGLQHVRTNCIPLTVCILQYMIH